MQLNSNSNTKSFETEQTYTLSVAPKLILHRQHASRLANGRCSLLWWQLRVKRTNNFESIDN